MRMVLVLGSLLPFLYYAGKDGLFHFRGRKVTATEHLLHLVIGLSLVIVVTHAVLGNTAVMLIGLLFFALAGALDEYVWHRGIPDVESDLHAKEHLALLIFLVTTLSVDWLESHHWQIPADFLEQLRAARQSGDTGQDAQEAATLADPGWLRWGVLPLCLAPYACFGISDNLLHLRYHRVSWTERVLHLTIVAALFIVVPHAIYGSLGVMIVGLALFLVARSLDEWVFHRNLAGEEIDKHAKTHFAFLLFVAMCMAVEWHAPRS